MSALPPLLLGAAGWLAFGLVASAGLVGLAKSLSALGVQHAADPEPAGPDHD